MTKIDTSKAAELKKKLEKHKEEIEKKIEFFDLDEMIQRAREIKEVEIKGLGVVKYGSLTVGDLFRVAKLKDEFDILTTVVALMLQKADPSVTIEKVKQLPVNVMWALIRALAKDMVFLVEKESGSLNSGLETGG